MSGSQKSRFIGKSILSHTLLIMTITLHKKLPQNFPFCSITSAKKIFVKERNAIQKQNSNITQQKKKIFENNLAVFFFRFNFIFSIFLKYFSFSNFIFLTLIFQICFTDFIILFLLVLFR